MRRWSRTASAALVGFLLGVASVSFPAHGSELVPPAASAQEISLAGNVVALPLNGVSALFHNPAQLTLLPNSATTSILAIRYHPGYANTQGYDETSREMPVAPSFAYVTDRWAPFHVGIGAYGSLGFAYNLPADPARGILNNLYTDLAVLSLAPSVAYSLTPELHVGVGINPSYGRLRLKSPTPVGRLDVDVRGPGIFGTLGILYTPTPKLSLGLGYKTPGTIFMFGNARVAGRGDNVKVDFQFPQTLEFGAAYRVTKRLTVVAQARWAEFSAFEDTSLKFDHRKFLNRGAVEDAKDRFRLGAGVQFVLFPGVTFQTGFSWERWAIKSSSLAPTLPDFTESYLFPAGLTIEHGPWEVHVAAGQSHVEDRHVKQSQNPAFPGRYSLDQAIFAVQVTRLFGGSEETAAP